MSRLLISLTLLAAPIFGQGPSQGDRDYTISALHATRKQFLDTVGPLSEAQMKWKPSESAWSVAEVAEHLITLENMLPGMLAKAMAAPAAPEKKKPNPRETEEMMLKVLPARERKVQTSEALKPTGKYPDKAALVNAFRTARDKNIAYVRETNEDLRSHFMLHPVFGELDGFQWCVFIAAHTERHVNQMKEVIATAGFPAQ